MRTTIVTAFSTAVLFLVAASSGMSQERPSIEDFVLAIHTEGFTHSDVSEYSAEDLDLVFPLLRDERHAQFWPAMTKLIGLVGGDSEVRRLIEFVRGEHNLSRSPSTAVLRGRASGVSSLGYLARTAKSSDALEYLLRGVDPDIWIHDREWAPWVLYHSAPGWVSEYLGTSAVRGLAVSGQPKAVEKLWSLAHGDGSHEVIRRTAASVLASLELEAAPSDDR